MDKDSCGDTVLGPYRVLDLADEKGLMCGMLLADLGADVIKVEKPGGDATRRIGPFHHDEPHPEKSLYWFAFNRNKRGITLDIETADGRDIFKRLVETADFVVETNPPGYMADLGLGYAELEKINPRIVFVSITDWGQNGPYVDNGWKADDMVLWALGGEMWLCGDRDRPPVQVTFPHSYMHAGSEGAVGAMAAHYYREVTGEGQHVDISIQACIPQCNLNATSYWDIEQVLMPRGTSRTGTPRADGMVLPTRSFWKCKDGYVIGSFQGGMLKPITLSAKALVNWMAEEGMAGDLVDVDLWNWDRNTIAADEVLRQAGIVQEFIARKTKAEIYERAVRDKIIFAPVNDPTDLAASPQLRSRGFFVDIEHPELGGTLSYCGPFFQFSETPLKRWFRAPFIGEHNVEVYGRELGFSTERLEMLMRAKVI